MSSEPFAKEHALTRAGRGTKESQSAVQTLVEAFDQSGTEDHIRQRWGNIELSGKN